MKHNDVKTGDGVRRVFWITMPLVLFILISLSIYSLTGVSLNALHVQWKGDCNLWGVAQPEDIIRACAVFLNVL